MNIKDTEKVEVPEGAPLQDIFNAQSILEQDYRPIEEKNLGVPRPEYPVNLHDHKGQEYLRRVAFRCISEIIEATECLKNKAWKITPMETDVDHFKEEVSDAFHFFIDFCIAAGISASELYELYFAKHDVNRFRQRSEY